jgi:hypothetical protein
VAQPTISDDGECESSFHPKRLSGVGISVERACQRGVEAVVYVLRLVTPGSESRGHGRPQHITGSSTWHQNSRPLSAERVSLLLAGRGSFSGWQNQRAEWC